MLIVADVCLGEQSSVREHAAANADWQASHHDVAVAGAKEIEQDVQHRRYSLSHHLASPTPVCRVVLQWPGVVTYSEPTRVVDGAQYMSK